MKGNFSVMLRKYCLDGTIVGLKYFYLYPDKISRLFWSAVMIYVTSFACLLTFALYRRFEQMPTRMAIENQYELVYNLPFPAITLCSPNQITKSAAKHFDRTLVDGNRSLNLEYILPKLLGFYEFVELDQPGLEHLQTLIDINRYDMPEVLVALAQSCSSFLKVCYFRGTHFPKCKGLFKEILTKHGLCCVFNSPYYFKEYRRNEKDTNFKPVKVMQSGLNYALTVVTDFEPRDAVDETVLYGGSTRVMLTDWTEFPTDDETSIVHPNAESFHSISATHSYCSSMVEVLPPSSRECYFESEQKLQFFFQYHNSDCDMLCFAHAVEVKCHCQLFYMPYARVPIVCNVSMIQCIDNVKLHMSGWMELGHCDCPRDCDSRRYKAELAIGNFAALPYMITNPYLDLKFNSSTSVMHFFFPTSTYVKQKQETVMSITNLVSNLGGVFGLCIGCSVISVYELLFFVRTAIINKFKNKVRRRRQRRVAFYGYFN